MLWCLKELLSVDLKRFFPWGDEWQLPSTFYMAPCSPPSALITLFFVFMYYCNNSCVVKYGMPLRDTCLALPLTHHKHVLCQQLQRIVIKRWSVLENLRGHNSQAPAPAEALVFSLSLTFDRLHDVKVFKPGARPPQAGARLVYRYHFRADVGMRVCLCVCVHPPGY